MIRGIENVIISQTRDIVQDDEAVEQEGETVEQAGEPVKYIDNPKNPTPFGLKVSLDISYDADESEKIHRLIIALGELIVPQPTKSEETREQT